jgi:hypothetical protein
VVAYGTCKPVFLILKKQNMQIVKYGVTKYDMISIPVPFGTTSTTFAFPDQPQLRDVKVWGMDLPYSDTDFYNQNSHNYTAGFITNGFLNLYFDGKVGVENMPLREISNIYNSGTSGTAFPANGNGILAFNGQRITWTKSNIQFATAPTGFLLNGVIVIGVYYTL